MSRFGELLREPPVLMVKGNPREIKIDLVSATCDNRYRWTVKKDKDGDWKINTGKFAYSNFQTKHGRDDIEWIADEGNWNKVFDMINTGTSRIEAIKYR